MKQSAEYSYSFFIDKGYSPEAAAAIVGNFDHESGFNSRAIHDEGTGYGIAGWRDPPGDKKGRRAALMEFAKANKLNPNSLGTQLEFADHELRTSEKRAGRALKKARTVEEANIAMMHYERPDGYSKDKPQAGLGYGRRLAKAKAALQSYAGNAVNNPDMRDDRQPAEFVDTTDTEAIPTDDMGGWDEESMEAAADAIPAEGEEKTSSLKQGIQNLLAMQEEKQEEPFDYTPAGEGIDVNFDPTQGAVPLDAYRNYSSYSSGGNVEEESIDPHEFFAMILGAR